jgi:signal transduction histidine kinase
MQYQLSLHESRPQRTERRVHSLKCEAGANWLLDPQAGAEISQDALTDELLKIQEYERQRMGQELHDSAGQLLVALQLSVARLRAVENSGHEDLIDEVQEMIRQIDRQIRSLAFLHYPAELDEKGLCFAIDKLVRGFDRRTGIRATFRVSGNVDELDDAKSEALLRVAQEGLVNIHRHAHATTAKVHLQNRNGKIILSVADDGVGFPSKASDVTILNGVGLQSMAHRMHVLGGTIEVRPQKRGLKLVATIPLQ